MLEGVAERIGGEFGAQRTGVATGGMAPLFAEATDRIDHRDTDLTLRGLAMVYRRNAKA